MTKNSKTYISRFVAFMLSTIYLFSPIRGEILDALHTVSHHLKKPSFVLSHDNAHNLENSFYKLSHSNHQHDLIDFFDVLLSTETQTKDANLPPTKDLKIDKHVCSPKIKINDISSLVTNFHKYCFTEIPIKGFLKKRKIPPELV